MSPLRGCFVSASSRPALAEVQRLTSGAFLLPNNLSLLHNLRDRSGSDRMPTFADRKAQALLHRHRRDQLDRQTEVVPRHHHLRARRQLRYSGHVRGSQIELRTIPLEERRMSPAFFLRQDVDLSLELGVRRDRSRLRQHHAALHIFLRDAAQQEAGIVARQAFVQLLLEHLDAGHDRLAGLPEADNFYFLAYLYLAALDSSRNHSSTALNRENIFDRHQERL